jgi:hypothetical protein
MDEKLISPTNMRNQYCMDYNVEMGNTDIPYEKECCLTYVTEMYNLSLSNNKEKIDNLFGRIERKIKKASKKSNN